MDVKAWLKGFGLEQYAAAFAENGIDTRLLPQLTNEDLKDLGVAKLADRKVILNAISQLTESEDRAGSRWSAPAAAVGERRQATILFADVSGFTKLSTALDAEETHALLNRYFEVVDDLVESYGGTIDKHIGDNVMAVFGAPIAHTDDPERAVRAACDIHAAMEGLSRELSRTLCVHIGIASGQVVANVTGSRSHREYTVTGDAVNLAARLQDMARPGKTLISGSVRESVSRVAACASRGEISVKGFQRPVQVWSVDCLLPGPPFDLRSPFVGRCAELVQFRALVEESVERGRGHVILIRGEPGIGKTRLVEEFAEISKERGLVPHKALVLDFGVGKGLGAIHELVRSLLAIPPGSGQGVRQKAADRAISPLRIIFEDHRVFLNDLLDLPQPTELRGLYDAMDATARNKGKQETVSRLVSAMAGRAPLIIIIEDIHWADQPTLDHLASVAATVGGVPALLVVTTRIEGKALEHDWPVSPHGCPVTIMEPSRLSVEEATALARTLVPGSTANLEAYVERAEGNPLFLEQLLSAAETARAEMPDTLRGLVLARMDRLPGKDRLALQAASVIGQRFSLEALRELMGDEQYGCSGLVACRLVRPEETDYLFAHALIQEGVYSSLLKGRRRELHSRAAKWFAQRDLVLRAEHLDRAADVEAPRAYLAAAQEQAQQVRYERALQLVRRGLEIAPESGNFALRCLEGDLLRSLGSVSGSIDAYRHALEVAVDDADRCRAWIGVAEGLRLSGEHNELLKALDHAEVIAKAHDIWPEFARICQLRGGVHFVCGEIEACLRVNTTSLEYARRANSAELEAQALGGLGDAEFARGRMISAYSYYHRSIELGREHGLARIVAANLSMRGQTLLYRLDLEAALNDCRAAAELAARIRQPRAELIATIVAAYVSELGNPGEGQAWTGAGLDIARRLGTRAFESCNLEYLARFAAQEGARSEAQRLAREAIAILRESESGMRFQGAKQLGILALLTDDPEERRAALQEAQELLRGGAGAHNHLWFYRDAIETSLQTAQWDEVERYARALEDYTHGEPLPWSDLFIARGRVLAAFGRGQRDEAILQEIRSLRDDMQRLGVKHALQALDNALLLSPHQL